MQRLGLYKMCFNTSCGLEEREPLSSRTVHMSGAHLAFANHSVLGGKDTRVVEIGFGGVEGCLLSVEIGKELGITRIEHSTRSHFGDDCSLIVGETGFCLFQVRLASQHHCSEALLVGNGLLEMLMCG